ncbi:MAG: helix-turn-helix domain-containing protein [Candidatus Limnocylindrales bacterium]
MPTRATPPGPLQAALERIGDRWSPRLVEALLAGPLRYGELQAAVAGIAPNILADRLRRLEADGLLTSTAYAERPPRFEYRLTAEGRALAGALRLLADWGARHASEGAGPDAGGSTGRGPGPGAAHAPIRHADCGTALEARWFCPTCDLVVDADPVEGLRHL